MQNLRNSILNFNFFFISLFMLYKGFNVGLPLSKLLQKSNIDLKLAMQLANDTKQKIQELRINVEEVCT